MALSDIFIGAANIYVGGSIPATGSASKLSITAGVPSNGGTLIGSTGGPAKFKVVRTKREVEVEQALSAVRVLTIKEEVTLEFSPMEIVMSKLQAFLQGTTLTVDSASTPRTNFIQGGGNPATPVQTVTLVTADATKSPVVYTGIVIYNAFVMSDFELDYAKATETMLKVTLKGLADTTRPIGDMTYQMVQQY